MKIEKPVRVRFAPSPTGFLHIGSLRTALFNWLFARHHKGEFFLRIEDTDLNRSEKKYSETIIHALEWAGITWDGSVTYQSDRTAQHKMIIDQLLKEGTAYKCYCTTQDIMARLEIKEAEGDVHLAYDEHCREQEPASKKDAPFVVRFKLPDDISEIEFDDLIRGKVVFEMDQLDDFIIARSDGRPVYNFVVTVDDAHMKISQIIRGEDHISNTPKQILLYNACGYTIPQFAHLPLILSGTGGRLSKRDAATSVWDYKETGYLPDALINYLVRLGWSHGDQELFTRDELIEYFTLDNVGKKAALFDMDKLRWFNGIYIRKLDSKELLEDIFELRNRFRVEMKNWSDHQVLGLIDLYKQRVTTLIELADDVKALHDASTPFDTTDISKWITEKTQDYIREVIKELVDLDPFTSKSITECIKQISKKFNCKLTDLTQPIRIALTGKGEGPGVFALLDLLGKQESVDRLHKFEKYLQEHQPHHV